MIRRKTAFPHVKRVTSSAAEKKRNQPVSFADPMTTPKISAAKGNAHHTE